MDAAGFELLHQAHELMPENPTALYAVANAYLQARDPVGQAHVRRGEIDVVRDQKPARPHGDGARAHERERLVHVGHGRALGDRPAQADAARVQDEAGGEEEFEPMNAYDRKVIHDVAAQVSGVESFSRGEGADRRVVIRAL